MTSEQLVRYAELLLWCIGGIDGRKLLVRTETANRELAVQVARSAYEAGARLVMIDYDEPLLVRARMEFAADSDLSAQPDVAPARYAEFAGEDWSLIRIHGSEEPDYLAGMDPGRVAAYSRVMREIMLPLSQTVSEFRKHWVGALMPSRALAAKACSDLTPDDAFARYESEIVRVLGLDEPDPTALWAERIAELSARRDALNGLSLDSIHLKGPGTDLTVGLLSAGRWATAQAKMPDGRMAFVNMPSLEVFTSPDLRRTSGRVAASQPYMSTSTPGTLIRGAWFEFRDGAVVDSGAEEGNEILQSVLAMDAQARYLGEIALVDSKSAVAEAGFTFYNTLYDENAATHMALGRGFPRFVDGTQGMKPAELIEVGVNHSLVHDDVMIGSPQMDVDGLTTGGDTVPIMRDGSFVL